MKEIFSFAQVKRAGCFVLLFILIKLIKVIFLHQRAYTYI